MSNLARKRLPRGALVAGVLASLQIAQVTPARAEPAASRPDLAAAKRHYNDALTKYQSGDINGALVEFRTANEIKPTPQAERLIARCFDALGQFRDAAEWYQKFLAHVPESMAAHGDRIRTRVTEIQAMPGKVHVDSNHPGATITVDGKAEAVPAPLDLQLSPGSHVVAVVESGRAPVEKTVEVAYASEQAIRLDFEGDAPNAQAAAAGAAQSPNPAPPPANPETGIPASVWIAGGVAIAAAGVGTAFGLAALDDKNQFDQSPTTQNANNRNVHALVADFSFGVALVSGLASAFLFFGSRGSTPPPPPPPQSGGGAAHAGVNAVVWAPSAYVDGHGGGGAGLVLHF